MKKNIIAGILFLAILNSNLAFAYSGVFEDYDGNIVIDHVQVDPEKIESEESETITLGKGGQGDKDADKYYKGDSSKKKNPEDYINEWLNDDSLGYIPGKGNDKDTGYSIFDDAGINIADGSLDFPYDIESESDGYVEVQEEKEKKTGLSADETTIQYSFDIYDRYRNYIDTGKVTSKGIVELMDIKDILKELSVKRKGRLVESKKECLLYIDGKIEKLPKKEMTVEEFLSYFDNFGSLNILSQRTRTGRKYAVADYLETYKDIPIEVNGEMVDSLTVRPLIQNSQVLFPLREIFEGLNAKVDWNHDLGIATIKRADKTIKIKRFDNVVNVNGKFFELQEETYARKKEKRIVTLVDFILKELGANMAWDAQRKVLLITDEYELEQATAGIVSSSDKTPETSSNNSNKKDLKEDNELEMKKRPLTKNKDKDIDEDIYKDSNIEEAKDKLSDFEKQKIIDRGVIEIR